MKKQHDVRIDRSKLHPWLDYKLGLLLKECEKKGIYLIITEGFRTVRKGENKTRSESYKCTGERLFIPTSMGYCF